MSARAIVQAMLDAFARGDWAEITRYIAEDVVIHEAPSMPYPGDFRGLSGFQALVEKVMKTWRDFDTKPELIFEQGDRAAILSRISGRGGPNDIYFEMPFVEVFRVRDGKVVEITPFYWDTKRLQDIHLGKST